MFAAFGVLSVWTATAATAADDYPSKPGRLIVPSGAGSSSDIMGRICAQRFSEAWGQPLVVDNRAGAAGIIATELAARAAPDGYTIFNYGIGQSIVPALHKKLPYNHSRDFMPISTFAMTPNLLTVTPSLGVATVQEFISAAKRAEQLPTVPTVIESGVPNFDVAVWQGFAVPRGTPQIYVTKVYAAMMKAVASPELKQRFFENGVAAVPMTPAEFAKFAIGETAKWQKAVTVSGMKPE